MNINKIKEKIIELGKEKIRLKINMGRNKYEYIDGTIENIHPNIFTIRTDRGLKSFTYIDVLIKNVIISKF